MRNFTGQRMFLFFCFVWFFLSPTKNYSQQPTIETKLPTGSILKREIKQDDIHSYEIKAKKGDLIKLAVTTTNAELEVVLLNPKTDKIKEARALSDSNKLTNVYLIVHDDGNYRVQVKSLYSGHSTYSIFLSEPSIPTEIDQEKILANDLFHEGFTLQNSGNRESLESSIEKLKGSLKIWEKVNDSLNQKKCLTYIGVSYLQLREYQKSIEHYESALKIAEREKDFFAKSEILNEIGLANYYLGNYEKSLSVYNSSLIILENFSEDVFRGIVLHNLALVHDVLGNLNEAAKNYRQALEIFIANNNLERQPLSYFGLAENYKYLGKISESLELLNKALEISRKINNKNVEIDVTAALGRFYASLGDHQQALEYYYTAERLNEYVKDKWLQGIVLSEIGLSQLYLGDTGRSVENFDKALKVFTSINFKIGESAIYNNLGLMNSFKNKDKEALEWFSKSLALCPKNDPQRVKTNINKATSYLNLKKFDEAYQLLNEALEQCKKDNLKPQEVLVMYSLAQYYFVKGEYDKTKEACSGNLNLLTVVINDRTKIKTLALLAKANAKQNNYKEAGIFINEALELSLLSLKKLQDDKLRVSLLSLIQDFYELNISLEVERFELFPELMGDVKSLELAEASRNISLLMSIKEKQLQISNDDNKLLVSRKMDLEKSISVLSEQIVRKSKQRTESVEIKKKTDHLEKLKKELFLVKSEFYKKNLHYLNLVTPDKISFKEIKGEFTDKDTLILEYFLGKDASYLWAIADNDIKIYKLPPLKDIEKIAAEYIRQIRIPPTNENSKREIKEISRKLSEMILAPVNEKLQVKRLIIIPDKILSFVPFSSLENPNLANPDPLISTYEIISIPSLSLIQTLQKVHSKQTGQKELSRKIAVIADPIFEKKDPRVVHNTNTDYSFSKVEKENLKVVKNLQDLNRTGENLERLPGTRIEAESIRKNLKKFEVKIILDFDSNLLFVVNENLEKYSIIHIATHAFINNNDPELSGLVLSLVDTQGNEQPGFLTVNQILGLKLEADLVVLSACETGIGRYANGEGVMSFSRSFFYAGAKRIVTSLWKVDDEFTAEFMAKFYTNISNGENYANALRLAQTSMIKQKRWADPFYWAAFQIQGYWK